MFFYNDIARLVVYFDQFLGAAHTWKLIFSAVFNLFFHGTELKVETIFYCFPTVLNILLISWFVT